MTSRKQSRSRRTSDDDYTRPGQVLWTLFVAICVAIAALYQISTPVSPFSGPSEQLQSAALNPYQRNTASTKAR